MSDNPLNTSAKRSFCSWSGGKDSCLALHRALQAGFRCEDLFTMNDETGRRSHSHGLTPTQLLAQAAAMNFTLHTVDASWGHYEEEFKAGLRRLRRVGVTHGIFGDIDLLPHREWVERICREGDMTAILPLWQDTRSALIREFIAAGFKALIVVVNTDKMPQRFLGRSIDAELVGELERIGVDACGENGEYHSFVFDGPLFTHPLLFTSGVEIARENYAFLPLEIHVNAAQASADPTS